MDSEPISSDLRAVGHARRRFLDRQRKYNSFKHVSAGALASPHYDLHQPSRHHSAGGEVPLPHTCAVTYLSSRQLFELAQAWPRPPKLHHASPDKWRDKWGKTPKWDTRRADRKWLKGEGVRRQWMGGQYRIHVPGTKCGWHCRPCEDNEVEAPQGWHNLDTTILSERITKHNEPWSALVASAEEKWRDEVWEFVGTHPGCVADAGDEDRSGVDDESFVMVELL